MFSTNNINIGIINRNRHFDGGRGTINNPYRIVKVRHLNNVRKYTNMHFRLENDIVFTDEFENDGEYYNGGLLWEAFSLSGTFNGNRYKIENLKSNPQSSNRGGFINTISGSGKLHNTYFKNLDFNNPGYNYGGGIVFNLSSTSASIEDVFVEGVINLGTFGGGILARSSGGSIRRCGVNATITGSNVIGGIFGGNSSNVYIYDTYSRGTLSVSTHRAGISGSSFGIRLYRCYSAMNITGGDFLIRGLISAYDGSSPTGIYVEDSYWDRETTRKSISSGGGVPLFTNEATFPYEEYTSGVTAYDNLDFDTVWRNDTEGINGGYPYLRNVTPGGIIDDYTYLIDTFEDDNLLTNFDDVDEKLLII